jgi:ABC-type lipoprotein release transport system permease subunit
MTYSSIAFRSLKYEPKRYLLLFVAASFGIALVMTAIGLMNGLLDSFNNKARIYYGGDLILLHSTDGNLGWYNTDDVITEIEPYFTSKDFLLSYRIDYENNNTYLFFEGESLKQRKIKGVDFEREDNLFSSLTFSEGSKKILKGTNGIYISSSTAENLNLKIGDNVTLMLRTTKNYTETATLVVEGIFQDSSLFGANVSYLDFEFLRSMIKYPKNYSISIGAFSNKNLTNTEILIIQNELKQFFNMYDLVEDKQIFIDNLAKSKGKTALITLTSNLENLNFLILALRIIIYIIIAVLIIIIAIGIGSTYKVIAVKRTKEIGMYMALGLSSNGIIKLFIIEVFYLMLFAFICSNFIMLIMANIISSLDLSLIPAIDIFLMNGKLLVQPHFFQILLILGIVVVTTMILVYFTIRRCVNINPVEALSVTE